MRCLFHDGRRVRRDEEQAGAPAISAHARRRHYLLQHFRWSFLRRRREWLHEQRGKGRARVDDAQLALRRFKLTDEGLPKRTFQLETAVMLLLASGGARATRG